MSDPTPEQKILEIFSLFSSLPLAYQSQLFDRLQGQLDANTNGWETASESEIEVEIIDDQYEDEDEDEDD